MGILMSVTMSTMSDVHQFRVRTPSFLIIPDDIPAQLSVLQKSQLYVEQLRREASKQRIPVSDAIADMKDFVAQMSSEDCLLTGFNSSRPNPFREKSSCALL